MSGIGSIFQVHEVAHTKCAVCGWPAADCPCYVPWWVLVRRDGQKGRMAIGVGKTFHEIRLIAAAIHFTNPSYGEFLGFLRCWCPEDRQDQATLIAFFDVLDESAFRPPYWLSMGGPDEMDLRIIQKLAEKRKLPDNTVEAIDDPIEE